MKDDLHPFNPDARNWKKTINFLTAIEERKVIYVNRYEFSKMFYDTTHTMPNGFYDDGTHFNIYDFESSISRMADTMCSIYDSKNERGYTSENLVDMEQWKIFKEIVGDNTFIFKDY